MNDAEPLHKYESDLRGMARSGIDDLEGAVAGYLGARLSSCGAGQRLALLETLRDRFGGEDGTRTAAVPPDAAVGAEPDVTRLVRRFLGRSSSGDAASGEVLEQFAAALDVLFDELNEIIAVINVRLLGQSPELETIRKVIGSSLDKGADNLSIKEYLDQIRQAFLVAHSSFQDAATTLIGELLAELDPAALAQSKSHGLKFGALRKAELFDQYQEKYGRCSRWFASGEHRETLLREFEKNCRRSFKTKSG
jgi:hypothetical protein